MYFKLLLFLDTEGAEGVFSHTVALTLIKDIDTRWNSTYYMLERCVILTPFIMEVCHEFNISSPNEYQWNSAKQLVRIIVMVLMLSTDFDF